MDCERDIARAKRIGFAFLALLTLLCLINLVLIVGS